MKSTVRFVADLEPVEEVSLRGTADLTFWTSYLDRHGLTPCNHKGRAQLLLVSAAMRFWGIRFREFSVSIRVHPPDDAETETLFLVQAFNSCRFFAFSERTFFSTPYTHGDVTLATAPRAAMRLAIHGETVFRAEMSPADREPASDGPSDWSGVVYLPRPPGARQRSYRAFLARISGLSRCCPFAPADVLMLRPGGGGPMLLPLHESGFVAEEWIVRDHARHAKSRTYRVLVDGGTDASGLTGVEAE